VGHHHALVVSETLAFFTNARAMLKIFNIAALKWAQIFFCSTRMTKSHLGSTIGNDMTRQDHHHSKSELSLDSD
jgi:hypothetical protein